MFIENPQKITYRKLIALSQEFALVWGVEGMSLATFRVRFLGMLNQAQASGLSIDQMRTALQIGEYRGSY